MKIDLTGKPAHRRRADREVIEKVRWPKVHDAAQQQLLAEAWHFARQHAVGRRALAQKMIGDQLASPAAETEGKTNPATGQR